MTPAEILAAYGRLGWWVAWTGDITRGKDPKGVLHWKRRPEHLANPGFAAGQVGRLERRNVALVLRPSRVLAIDCDSLEDVRRLRMLTGGLPETAVTRTSRGCHFLYRLPEDAPFAKIEVNGSVKATADGVVMLPPSRRPDVGDGCRYDFEIPPGGGLADMPAGTYRVLIDAAASRVRSRRRVPPARVALDGELGTRYGVCELRSILVGMAGESEGGRHRRLFASAARIGELAAAGHLDGGQALGRLKVAAGEAWAGEHADREIEVTVRDGFERGRA